MTLEVKDQENPDRKYLKHFVSGASKFNDVLFHCHEIPLLCSSLAERNCNNQTCSSCHSLCYDKSNLSRCIVDLVLLAVSLC
jgi:hypothetical protein